MKNSHPSSATNRSILTCECINSRLRFLLHRGRGVVARIVLLSILLPGLAIAKDKDFTILVDPKLPDDGSTTVWLGYLLARAKYREDHKVPLPASGDVIPTFREETYARAYAAQIYQEWKGEHTGWSEVYWETLSEIKAKGFMDAYVWTYLRQASWSKTEQPENLAAFQAWGRSLLKNHKAQTHGALVVNQK
jgi:hypothetical protein